MTNDTLPPTRKAAKSLGISRYFTGLPCTKGHIDFRYVSSGQCAQCGRDKAKVYAKANPDVVKRGRQQQKERYKADTEFREKVKARAKAWEADNPERIKARRKEYYQANKEKITADNRDRWAKYRLDPDFVDRERARKIKEYRDFPERRLASWAARRAREKGIEGKFKTSDIKKILKMQGNKCAYCACDLSDGYEVDHITPVSKGGTNWPKNLQCCCMACNRKKSSKDPVFFAQEIGRLI